MSWIATDLEWIQTSLELSEIFDVYLLLRHEQILRRRSDSGSRLERVRPTTSLDPAHQYSVGTEAVGDGEVVLLRHGL